MDGFWQYFAFSRGKGGSVGKMLCYKSIELVEFYLEPVKVELEPVHRRIGPGNTKIWTSFGRILHFWGVRGGLSRKFF